MMSKEKRKRELGLIFMMVFLYLVGFGVLIPILPILSTELGASPAQLGILMASYSFMQFVFSSFWGQISDRYGRKPVFLICLFGEALSYAFFAFSRSYEALLFARILSGFFGASISTAAAAISDVTTDEDRSKGMALIGAAFGLGFIFGPVLGGGIAALAGRFSAEPFFGSSAAMLFVSLLCLLNFIFTIFFFRETKVNSEKSAVKKFKVLALFEDLQRPIIGTLIFGFLLISIAMAAMESTLALLTAERWGWGLFEISLGFAYVGVLSTFNQGYLVRKLLPKFGESKLLLFGVSCLVISFALTAVSFNLPLMALAMTLLSIGSSFVNPAVMGSLSRLAGKDEQGRILGSHQATASLGRIIGPLSGGFLFQNLGSSSPYWLAAFLATLTLFMFFRIRALLPTLTTSPGLVDDSVLELNVFQFVNLIEARVRFQLLVDGEPLRQQIETFLNPVAKLHFRQIAKVCDFSKPLENPGDNLDEPITLICADGKKSKARATELAKKNFKNMCYLKKGYQDLVASGESSALRP